MTKGRVKEAYEMVNAMAAYNGKKIPEHMLPDPKKYSHSEVKPNLLPPIMCIYLKYNVSGSRRASE
jgi:hypothetical protein